MSLVQIIKILENGCILTQLQKGADYVQIQKQQG